MSGFEVALGAFHFLRPAWLLVLPLAALIWWWVRTTRTRHAPPAAGIAPHLRDALTVGAGSEQRLHAIDGVALTVMLLALGAAGPTWSRQPDPFVAQSAPAVVVLEVTDSMQATDVAPSRLERGKQKIRDLLALRAGARTALVAYAGTVHGVLPMTEDRDVMVPYLEGLTPDVMPVDGARAGEALAMAEEILAREEAPGGVIFVTDGLEPADAAALESEDAPETVILVMLPEGERDRGLDQLSGPLLVPVTPDDSDVRRIDRALDAAYRRAMLEESDQPWEDRGPWLAWPAAILALLWFRRGWTMRWAGAAVVAGGLFAPQPAHAGWLADLFLTPDQQGRIAYERRDFERAAELFVDPLWRGYALYRDGQYADAVETLDRLDSAEAAFIQAMAHIKNREYRDGVRAFETTLARDPDFPDAAENLEIAREIVVYVEDLREQSDTGEEAGIGADEVVFDNEAARGAETQIEVPDEEGAGLLTTEQWMSTVDTRTGDFLRQRFAFEAAQAPASGPSAGSQ